MTARSSVRSEDLLQGVASAAAEELRRGEHADPHALLGAHSARVQGREGVVVRAFHPDATGCHCLPAEGEAVPMEPLGDGLFGAWLPDRRLPVAYRLRFRFPDGATWEHDDPYRFGPTVGAMDEHLFGEGTHRRLWEVLGAHPRRIDGVEGTAFAVWAPSARRVSVVGDFNHWDGRLLPMRIMGSSGIFELFVPGVGEGALYKFEIRTREGALRLKTDPFAFAMEMPPASASRITRSRYTWGDGAWLDRRAKADPTREPMSIYEVHLGSWARVPEEGDRYLTYREIAPRLARHARELGFTHVELLPVSEHAFYGSWGYQVTGYYAPTARYGSPDDLRFLVDTLHQEGLGVILDWVPAHFPKDDFSLRRFDGTALYEHEDPRRGEHPDWGTLIFNYGRNEVRNFLVANALYWLKEFHVDGLRVDAVASMLYLDYSREAGEWEPNPFGGRENLEALDFLRATNRTVAEEVPGAITIAEESTAWPGVTRDVAEGGLGFTLKWNMGWMHDTLDFFQKEPVYRRWHQGQLSFSMVYEYTERFVNPLSHDEVVHGKHSLLEKLPGDLWQKLANLRLLLAYQWTRPGKQLVFMGTELAPHTEWSHERSLDWHLAGDEGRRGLAHLLATLGRVYGETPAFWRRDPEPESFAWIDCSDAENSVLSYVRRDGLDHRVVILNLTPVPRDAYRIGAPAAGTYERVLCTDDRELGGSGYPTPLVLRTEAEPWHGFPQSLVLDLPPLAALVLAPGD